MAQIDEIFEFNEEETHDIISNYEDMKTRSHWAPSRACHHAAQNLDEKFYEKTGECRDSSIYFTMQVIKEYEEKGMIKPTYVKNGHLIKMFFDHRKAEMETFFEDLDRRTKSYWNKPPTFEYVMEMLAGKHNLDIVVRN